MDRSVLLLLLITGIRAGATSYTRKFHFVNSPVTWSEAQRYCREKHTDLATAYTIEEAVELSQIAAANQNTWIGMYRGHFEWSNGLPVNFNKLVIQGAREPPCCGLVTLDGTWKKTSCLEQHSFLCYEETSEGPQKYIVVQQEKTWAEARRYCREQHTDLVTVSSATEDQDVKIKAQGTAVWIGLFYKPWKWCDGAEFSVDYFNTEETYALNQECGVVSVVTSSDIRKGNWNWRNDVYSVGTHKWNDAPCDIKLPFICFEGRDRLVQRMTLRVDPRINPNHPEMREYVLRQVKERSSQLGLTGEVQLWWREQQDGQVFHHETEESAEDQCGHSGHRAKV